MINSLRVTLATLAGVTLGGWASAQTSAWQRPNRRSKHHRLWVSARNFPRQPSSAPVLQSLL